MATAYGTNFRIMENGVQGFLASSNAEWVAFLLQLIDDETLRDQMGREGRKRVVERYSIQANLPAYENVLREVTE